MRFLEIVYRLHCLFYCSFLFCSSLISMTASFVGQYRTISLSTFRSVTRNAWIFKKLRLIDELKHISRTNRAREQTYQTRETSPTWNNIAFSDHWSHKQSTFDPSVVTRLLFSCPRVPTRHPNEIHCRTNVALHSFALLNSIRYTSSFTLFGVRCSHVYVRVQNCWVGYVKVITK